MMTADSGYFCLEAACPADFESRIIGPVVPVELMGFTIE